MKKIIIGIVLFVTTASPIWAAPEDVTPTTKAFTGYSGAGGKAKATAFNDTLKFVGATVNSSTKTVTVSGSSLGLGTAAVKDIPATGNATSSQVVYGTDTRLTDSRTASDVYSWAKASTKPAYTYSEVGALASGGTAADSSKLNGQLASYYQAASTAITTSNIASQTVTTATGNAGTATKLATGHTIAITGPITYTSPSFDGSGNVTAESSVASQTGTGSKFVMDTSPTLVKPTLGDASATTMNVTGASTGTTNFSGSGPSSTTKYHLGQFSDGTYFFNNYYYSAGHHADDATKAVCGFIVDAGGIDFECATASATPSRVSVGNISNTGVMTVNGGTNIVYYCNGGTNAGLLGRGNGGPCSGGSWVATSLKIN